MPPELPEEMATVARATSIPVATGERLTTKYEFARVLATGAASILQPNLGRVGGILEAKKIAAIAETHYAQIAPHVYCGPIVGAAAIQLATCTPNFLILEGIKRWDGFHAEILRTPIVWEDGHVLPPTAPGIGVELDEDVARANPYTGELLHLEPTYGPPGPPTWPSSPSADQGPAPAGSAQASIGTCPGWAATRASHAPIAGYPDRSKPPSGATCVYA